MREEMTKYVSGGLKVKDKFLIVVVIQNFTGYSEFQESISPQFKTKIVSIYQQLASNYYKHNSFHAYQYYVQIPKPLK